MGILPFLMLAWSTATLAHPFSKEEYSLRTALKVSEKGWFRWWRWKSLFPLH